MSEEIFLALRAARGDGRTPPKLATGAPPLSLWIASYCIYCSCISTDEPFSSVSLLLWLVVRGRLSRSSLMSTLVSRLTWTTMEAGLL